MFFDDWTGLLRTVVVGVLAYIAIILLLRITGKRTLSKMNAFDMIVTVALGSTLATVLLSQSVALAEGILGFAVLIFLQMIVAWASARWQGVRDLVKAEPTLLLHKGSMLDKALLDARVAPEEVMAAVRSSGFASLEQVEAVVLETDGSFSVVGPSSDGSTSALANVPKPGPAAHSSDAA
ncbi:DUF421 domain-containing protein [Skermanella mucosa]|uniref:DUF421 domain-containing protein n=1 Tax=Skermanella mucosa TaxID=1789672 RepID=UPI00192C70F1|nr:YetF domain-containing protein [Skermanella mucosa]UEM18570.1 DUF421 domain-containing protein [Skermanella mucosa]